MATTGRAIASPRDTHGPPPTGQGPLSARIPRLLPELRSTASGEDKAGRASSEAPHTRSAAWRVVHGPAAVPLSARSARNLEPLEANPGGCGSALGPGLGQPRDRRADASNAAPLRVQGLDTKYGDPVAMLALERWASVHGSQQKQHAGYKSSLLYCEAQLRKLEHLCETLRPPNPAVTALSFDLLKTTCSALPTPIQQACEGLLKLLDSAVYSSEPLSDVDIQQLRKVVPACSPYVPHFILAKWQQTQLEETGQKVVELKAEVKAHMERRQKILDFLVRLQREERVVLQQWLFRFWQMTYQYRRSRIARILASLSKQPEDILSPFVHWRLYVSTVRYERATQECQKVDMDAAQMADQITEVEIENETQQKNLQDALASNAAIKDRCSEEEQEHERLQALWNATQPELLLAVLGQTLELFFMQIVRTAHLSHIEVRHRLGNRDPSPMLRDDVTGAGWFDAQAQSSTKDAGPEVEEESENRQVSWSEEAMDSISSETLLIRWLNTALVGAREVADSWANRSLTAAESHRMGVVQGQPLVQNLRSDLSDGRVLCILFAVFKGQVDDNEVSPKDLWPLDETDDAIRIAQVCSLMPTYLLNLRGPVPLTAEDITSGNERALRSFLAACFLKESLLEELPSDKAGSEDARAARDVLHGVITKVEECVGDELQKHVEDPALLLQGREDLHTLTALTTERLLLRWMNAQLRICNRKPVKNFGPDLQDCEALCKLIGVVAPEVLSLDDIPDSREQRLDMLVSAGLKCTGTHLFTSSAILDEQPDMLAAFLAQVFLVRPNLMARENSLLSMHVHVLERTCTEGYHVLEKPVNNANITQFCKTLDQQWSEVTLALNTVHEANETMVILRSRMTTFLSETLAFRAQGEPRTMLDAKEAREFLMYTSVSIDKGQGFLMKELSETSTKGRIEELLRKHFRLLRDIYWYYSRQEGASAAAGVALDGLLKLYQDCKLRARELAPQHIEAMFNDHLDGGEKPPGTPAASTTERTLSPPGLVMVLLRCASIKYKTGVAMLPDQFSCLVEQHLKPHACQETGTVFQKMAYDKKVRQVLQSYTAELKAIFEVYARADISTAEAVQRVNTMNISEFLMLLSHAKLRSETLTESAVQQIFLSIQKTVADDDDDVGTGELGLDDDDELAFSEFLDGLVAIAAYINPDPFIAFSSRVNTLILQLFAALRRHWSRRRAPGLVDAMVIMLQKRLR